MTIKVRIIQRQNNVTKIRAMHKNEERCCGDSERFIHEAFCQVGFLFMDAFSFRGGRYRQGKGSKMRPVEGQTPLSGAKCGFVFREWIWYNFC